DRLQHGPATNHDLVDAIGFASGLVVGDAQRPGLQMFLDQVNRSPQPEASADDSVTANTVFVALSRYRSKPELEEDRPTCVAIASEILEPGVQVAADRGK